jgi:hypothetical protein
MTKFLNFDSSQFKEIIENWWEYHELYNKGLTEVFKEDEEHADIEKTRVKILLLDKAYSAGLRRWVRRCSETQKLKGCKLDSEQANCSCDAMSIFIAHLEKPRNKSKFQRIMQESRNIGGSLNKSNVSNVIKIHREFAELFQDRIRIAANSNKPANALSFFSKYLWFHAGIFPVLDNDARNGLRKLQGRGAPAYDNYKDYAEDIFALLMQAFGKVEFSPQEIKQLDYFLLRIGAGWETL